MAICKIKLERFFASCDLKIWQMALKTISHFFYPTSSFAHHFIVICEFNWSYSAETPDFGQNRRFLVLCDLDIWRMALQSNRAPLLHYNDVIMKAMASQITSLTIVYSNVYSGADQRKHQSSASLAFVWGIHPGPVNSPHKEPVTRKMFPFSDIIMMLLQALCINS